MRKLRVLEEKVVFEADLFTVKELKIEKKDGSHAIWHNVYLNPAVFVIPVTDNFEIYLIKQFRHTIASESLEVVAGFINKGEDPLEAVKRELEEETGLTAKRWKHIGTFNLSSSVSINTMYYYVARDLSEGEQRLDDTEEISIIKLPLKNAVEKVVNGEIINQKSVAGILLLDAMLQKGKL